MKNLSKIIVPISAIVFNTFAIFASSSRLLHFKPGIGMIVRVFDWHIWPQWKIIRLNLFTMEKGLHSKQRQLSCSPRTPLGFLFFPPSDSVKTLPVILLCHLWSLIHDFQDGAFRVLFETVCQRYRAINAASDRGFKLFFSLWCPWRRGKKEEPMVLEKS